jgi:hypothetical protein
MIVRFSTASCEVSWCSNSCDDAFDGSELLLGEPDGLCCCEVGFDGARDVVREDMVWLSRVRRREVMITWGTWYVLWRTWIAAAKESRSVIVVSARSLT